MRLRKLKGWLLGQGFNSKICLQNMLINHSYIKYDVFLGSVISALAEASAKQAANQKAHFIPYRLASKFFFKIWCLSWLNFLGMEGS